MSHTLDERVNLQVARAYTVHRRDDAAQHMVKATVGLRVLHRHHVLHVLYHTNGGAVAPGIGTDGTDIGVADVVAHAAVLDVLAHMLNGRGKLLRRGNRLTQQVKHQAQGSLAPYAGQFAELAYGPFKQGRRILFHQSLPRYMPMPICRPMVL